MIKYELNKFINIIKDEMLDFPEINKDDFKYWKTTFVELVNKNQINQKNIKKDKDNIYFLIEDEMDIFSIIDDFLIHKENNDLKTYWNNFK